MIWEVSKDIGPAEPVAPSVTRMISRPRRLESIAPSVLMDSEESPLSRRGCANRRSGTLWSIAIFTLAASGCNSPPFDFHALGLVPAQEKLAEFSLGRYTIPIPVMIDSGGESPRRHNRIQFDFELHALVPPNQESQVSDAWARHQGEVRDRVMLTCRSASVDDLQEPELGTLKSHLTDVLQAHLGKREIRQVLITDIVSQEL